MTSDVPTDTTDVRALGTASLDRTRNASTNDQDGTLIHIGGGVYLTAGHVLYQYVNPDNVRVADDYRIVAGDGLDAPLTTTIDAAAFGTAFHNFGWGTEGGTDMAVVFAGDAGLASQTLWAASDLNGLSGSLTTFGYPANAPYDGATQISVAGTLGTNGYQTINTGNGPATVLVSQPGMEVVSGQSGSGVWLDGANAGGAQTSFLSGIVSLDLTYVDGSKATGFEPIAEIYMDLAALLEGRGYNADDFARQHVTLSTAIGGIDLDGTFFNEDILGTAQGDTISGGGGDDFIYGEAGSDVLIDGAGIDTFMGGRRDGGLDLNQEDVFVLSLDGRADRIVDFQNGLDTIDISAWGVTGIGQLSITDHGSGRVIVRFDREAIIIDDGIRGLRASDLDASDFIFAASGGTATITGTAGRDLLVGTDADEVLSDLGGIDRLYGKGGADTFVLALDGVTDQIKDFENGLDLIDIAAWGATDIGQLAISSHTADRVIVRFDDEVLVLTGRDGPLATSDIGAEDFLFA